MEPQSIHSTHSTSSGQASSGSSTVTAEEFFKVELRVGRVENCEHLENSEKLFYDPSYFVDKLFVFAYNLEPRKMAGELSEGMLLCTDSESGPKPIVAPEGSKEGDRIK
ncbi:MAG: hypothetical protein AAB599_02085 [Patescibacteria group bacterium]